MCIIISFASSGECVGHLVSSSVGIIDPAGVTVDEDGFWIGSLPKRIEQLKRSVIDGAML